MRPLADLVASVKGLTAAGFLEILRDAKSLLSSEPGSTSAGAGAGADIPRVGGYVRIRSRSSRLLVIGDTHGDLETLEKVLRGPGEHVLSSGGIIALLGDYVDRGPYQAEVLALVLSMKLEYPGNVVALRGNHEPPPKLLPHPHDYPEALVRRFGDEAGRAAYELSMEVFQALPHIASTPNGIVMVHGGVPGNPMALEELADPDPRTLEELLWSDPSPVTGVSPSPRGAGNLFGPDITRRFLEANGASMIVRSHEPCEGYRLDHSGSVVTVFTRKGPPYYNRSAGYMLTDLSKDRGSPEDGLFTI